MNLKNNPPLFEDSFTLDHYMQISKRETLAVKKLRKESQDHQRKRKGSTQLSIFSWLHKGSTQDSLILSLDKQLILKIFGYLRVSQLVIVSQVCSYFLSCYSSLWNDRDFFSHLETDKFTSQELGRLIQKSSRLDHVRQLKQIYSGKNIQFCREKIKLRAGNGCPNTGGMLELFSVSPKLSRSGSTFLLDSHLAEVVSSSFRCLKVIQLVKCSMVKEFLCIAKCSELTRLVITANDNLRNQDLGVICKRCQNLQYIHLEDCRRLDENMFQHLGFVNKLKTLIVRHSRQGFGKLKKLENNQFLASLDLEGSLITDSQAKVLLDLEHITFLSIKNCYLLTDAFIVYLTTHIERTQLQNVFTDNCCFEQELVNKLQLILASRRTLKANSSSSLQNLSILVNVKQSSMKQSLQKTQIEGQVLNQLQSCI